MRVRSGAEGGPGSHPWGRGVGARGLWGWVVGGVDDVLKDIGRLVWSSLLRMMRTMDGRDAHVHWCSL